ncbi:hypothetical protein NVP1060A_64 [Vibrio phage 1.060.A._10N.261.48.B5]|nr:hypothetical protein NVP1060A_64 [Vibrio phage 1.060.A._10N.261.48.B5]
MKTFETKTPEEKEALDLIDTTPHQAASLTLRESSAHDALNDAVDRVMMSEEIIPREHLVKMIEQQTIAMKCLNDELNALRDGGAEWVNGEECRYANEIEHEYIYIGEHPHCDGHYVFSEEKGITYIANGYLLEPETEAERVERERLEDGQSLYEIVQSLWCTVDSKYTPHPYSSPMVDDKTKEMYARLARAVDYRKESE